MDELVTLIARMVHHYNQGGAGYTWLDAAIDVVGEHGNVILNQNGDGGGTAAIFINDATLKNVHQLYDKLSELGSKIDTATQHELTGIDEARADISEVLADVFEQLLLEAGLVQPLVASEGS